MSVDEVKEIRFACCYCGEDVKREDESPCQVVLITNWYAPMEEWQEQYWFAHEKCFREKLSQEANVTNDDADDGEWEVAEGA